MVGNAYQLTQASRTDEEIHRCEGIIDRDDNERVAHPYKARRCERDVLRHREFVRGSIEILHPRGDKAPLHERGPEKDGLGPSWMVHERLEFGR